MPRIILPPSYYSHFGHVPDFYEAKSTSDVTANSLLQPLRPGPEVALLTGVYFTYSRVVGDLHLLLYRKERIIYSCQVNKMRVIYIYVTACELLTRVNEEHIAAANTVRFRVPGTCLW